LDCADEAKTRVYLERSGSLPVSLSLDSEFYPASYNFFFELIPHAIGRLGSLTVRTAPEDLQGITDHLSHPAPLLEKLSIRGSCDEKPDRHPVLAPALFNGDLSSLCKLRLRSVRTKLPWRNMANLTSFTLIYTSPGEVTVGQLLDFFESAPHLRKVELDFTPLTSGAQNGLLVSLACLERMTIIGGGSASL
jgi:hypothetical protein